MKQLIRKIKSDKRGETIGETLAAVLIIAVAIVMLAAGIVSAANVNAKTKICTCHIRH